MSNSYITPPLKNNELYGNIDHVEAGIISGWAASRTSSNNIPLQVIANGSVLGVGNADIYRKDLEEAGIHSGQHGFRISLLELASVSGKISLKLIHAETLMEVNHPEFSITINSNTVTAALNSTSDGQVTATLSAPLSIGKQVLSLYHEDNLIASKDVYIENTPIDLSFPIPVSLQDGKPKLFKLGVSEIHDIVAMQWLVINPIMTPWQLIKDSYKLPGFMSLPPEAGARYESLQHHLDAIAKGKGVLSIKDLTSIHNVIIEGYEERKLFPGFSLPKYDSPRISVIVPACNKFELTYHCLASVALAYNSVEYEVILADDCSKDKTTEIEKIIDGLVVSRNPENLGFLLNCNRASKLAKGEYLVFLNNDTEVTSFWLDGLIAKLDEDPSVGLIGSKLLNENGTLQEAGGIIWGNGKPWNVGRNQNAYSPEYNYTREVDYVTGAAMCIRRELWEEVGYFSEEYAPCYYEDTDLAFKVRSAGYKVIYTPQSTVIHLEGKSHGRDVAKGLKKFQTTNENKFCRKWFSEFRRHNLPGVRKESLEKDRYVDQRILVIDHATPMPDKDAGSYAIFQEIKLMISLGFKVTFVPENLAHFGKYTVALQRMGAEVLYSPFYTSVHDVLNKRLEEMNAVYIVRYSVAEKYIGKIKSECNTKILFNNCDLHFLRELRSALRSNDNNEELEKSLMTREKELFVCKEADAVLCYNATEHAVITSHILEADKLHITPWVLESKVSGLKFEERKGIVFLGGYNHQPNVEAVKYLVSDIMPILKKKRPDICLYVYGSNMPSYFSNYESDSIKMIGFADHLDKVYCDHRVFVAPLRSGAGIKGKVLESMAYGLPAVLTDVAVEGTGLSNYISTLIASEPEDYVDAIIELYDDESLWLKLSENAKTLVKQQFSFEHGKEKFRDIFASVGLYSSS